MAKPSPLVHAQLLAELHGRQDQAIQAAMAASPPEMEKAGIVIVAGGGQAFTNAWVALTNLRDAQKSQLPIQMWHLGPDELSPVMRSLLTRFEVELVDAFRVRQRHPMRRLGPWECKVYATLHSRFRHVILLDADNVPLIDPQTLLDLPEYGTSGSIFWPDNHTHLPRSPVWKLFDVPYREELEVESGQLVVDKERCWVPLNLAVHYNAWSDIYYRYIYGDKETFHFAWRRLGAPYAMPEARPHTVYCHRTTPHGRHRMTAALEQADFAGNPIFHHRTGAKWSLLGTNPTTGRPPIDTICHDALAELRSRWDGRIAEDPVQPRERHDRSSATGRFRYRRVGVDERVLVLEADGRVSGGDSDTRWWCRDGDRLTIRGDDADTCHLTQDANGVWCGQELWYEQGPVELVPLDRGVHPAGSDGMR